MPLISAFSAKILGLEHGPEAVEHGLEPDTPLRRAAFIVGAPLLHVLVGVPLDWLVANPLAGAPAWVNAVGAAIAAAGLGLMAWSSALLWRAGWRPLTTQHPVQLLTSGPYAVVRHPWYLGGSMAVLGAALALGSFWGAVLSWPMFNLFLLALATGAEDRVLAQRFGDAWRTYRDQARPLWPGPGGQAVVRLLGRVLDGLSALVNRPLVLRFGKDHLIFLSYGLGQGLGAGLCLLLFKFLVWDRHPGWEADVLIVLAVVPGIVGNRLAGIASLVWGEGLSLREALGKVRFIAWGMLGGLLLAIFAMSAYLGQSPFVILDAATVSLMPAHFTGRLGCVFYGCCHGRPTTSPFAVTYHHPLTKPIWNLGFDRVRVFPTQLFSAAYGLIIASLVLGIWLSWPIPVGVPTCIAAALFGLFRFDEEWFRYGSGAGWQAMSFGQFYGLGIVASATALLWGVVPLGSDVWPARSLASATSLLTPSGLGSPIVLTVFITLVYGYHRGQVGSFVSPDDTPTPAAD